MAKGIYNINDIDDYMDKITGEQKKVLIKHCNRYEINPEICAWYSDWEDFCSDWCNENIGYTRTQARKLLHGGKGEFVIFSNREIIRLSM
ncbi:TPA: hypothetical protein N2D99_001995 [Clostridium botulinum]|nr:hypothetical protein [Clostridium botulinum]